MDISCTSCTCWYISGGPSRVCIPVILIPSNGVITKISRYNIHIPVPVHICCIDTACTSCISCYICSCPSRVCIPVILIPSNRVIKHWSRYDIHIPITVHICCIDRKCTSCTCCYISSGPCRVCITIILIPSNGVIIIRSRYDIHIPIPVHICYKDRSCTICTCCYISRRPCRVCITIILIPCNGIVISRRRYNIHISIPVHICCKDRVCTSCISCYIISGPSRVCIPVILIPSNGVVSIRSG